VHGLKNEHELLRQFLEQRGDLLEVPFVISLHKRHILRIGFTPVLLPRVDCAVSEDKRQVSKVFTNTKEIGDALSFHVVQGY